MAAIANNPKFAKKVGVSKSIGEEFMKSDKGRKFKEGGLKETDAKSNPGLAKLPTEVRNKMGYMKKGGMAEKEMPMKKGGKVKKMMSGGMHKMPDGKMMKDSAMKKMNMGGMAKGGGIESKGKTKGTMVKMTKGGKAC